jgi:hypothetical protein
VCGAESRAPSEPMRSHVECPAGCEQKWSDGDLEWQQWEVSVVSERISCFVSPTGTPTKRRKVVVRKMRRVASG